MAAAGAAPFLEALTNLTSQEKRVRLTGTYTNVAVVCKQLDNYFQTLPNHVTGEGFDDFLDVTKYPPANSTDYISQVNPQAAGNSNAYKRAILLQKMFVRAQEHVTDNSMQQQMLLEADDRGNFASFIQKIKSAVVEPIDDDLAKATNAREALIDIKEVLTSEDGDLKQDLSNTLALIKLKFNINRHASKSNDNDAVTGTELVGIIKNLLSSVNRFTKNGDLSDTADDVISKMVALLDEKFLVEGDDGVDDTHKPTIDRMIELILKADQKISTKKNTHVAKVYSTATVLASNPLPAAGSKPTGDTLWCYVCLDAKDAKGKPAPRYTKDHTTRTCPICVLLRETRKNKQRNPPSDRGSDAHPRGDKRRERDDRQPRPCNFFRSKRGCRAGNRASLAKRPDQHVITTVRRARQRQRPRDPEHGNQARG